MKIFRLDYSFYDDSIYCLIQHEKDKTYEEFLSDFSICSKKAGEEIIVNRKNPQIIDLFWNAYSYMISDFNYSDYRPDTIAFEGEILCRDLDKDGKNEAFLDEFEGSKIKECLGEDLVNRLCRLDEEKYEEMNKKLEENSKKDLADGK